MAGYSGSKKTAPHRYKKLQAEIKADTLKNILLFYGCLLYTSGLSDFMSFLSILGKFSARRQVIMI